MTGAGEPPFAGGVEGYVVTLNPALVLAIVGLLLVTALLLARMSLRSPDKNLHFTVLGFLRLDILQIRVDEPPNDQPPNSEEVQE